MRDGYASAECADDDLGLGVQLLRKRREQGRPHTVSSGGRCSHRRSDSVVGNNQLPVRPICFEGDHNMTFISLDRKCMLQGIDNELGYEEPDAAGCRRKDGPAADQGVKLDRPVVADQGLRETFAQRGKVWSHFDRVAVPRPIEVLLDSRNGHDSPMRIHQVKPRLLRWPAP